jgi:hypothetical protein
MAADLLFLAGHRAYERVRSNGLAADDVKMVVGASGAAKWLVLHGLESALFGEWFSGRRMPLHLYGTSIGSWKSAAAAQADPRAAFDCLAHAYIHQYYSGRITPAQVARETERIMNEFLGPGIPEEILQHPYCRLHLSAVRCRGLLASDNTQLEMAGLALAWLGNRFSRGLFRRFCLPTLFYDARDVPPFLDNDEFPGGAVPLQADNLRQALLGSGSIPYVMKSVRNIKGARQGAYRDGGMFHYHPAFDFLAGEEGIVLYPHFYNQAILGWFDKKRPNRVADGRLLADVLMLAPSPSFIADLPLGRIPDRRDFLRLAGRDDERVIFWEKTVAMSRRLGDTFMESVESGRVRELVQKIA